MKSAPNRYNYATASSLHRDRESKRGTRGLSSDFTPKKNLARGIWHLVETRLAAFPAGGRISGKKNLILADPVLQGGRQFVHIRSRKVHRFGLKDGEAVASDRVPPHLDQQGLQRLGIVFLRGHADQFLKCRSNRQTFAIGTLAGHGVEGIGQGHD